MNPEKARKPSKTASPHNTRTRYFQVARHTAPLVPELAALYPLSPDAHELIDVYEISGYKLDQSDKSHYYYRYRYVLYKSLRGIAFAGEVEDHNSDKRKVHEINNTFDGKYLVCCRNYRQQSQD